MTPEASLPPVDTGEWMARFITVPEWVRADRTVRQDAFIPPKDLKLSVTRHLGLSEDRLWYIGQKVVQAIAEKRNAGLYGRADVTVRQVSQLNLRTEPAALLENPNHAHIIGWPLDKPAQKTVAQQLAAAARYVPRSAPATQRG